MELIFYLSQNVSFAGLAVLYCVQAATIFHLKLTFILGFFFLCHQSVELVTHVSYVTFNLLKVVSDFV